MFSRSHKSPQSGDSSPAPGRSETDASFDQLVASHQQRIYYFIRSMVYNQEDARDVLQDVNIVLYRKQETYEPGTNFKAWALAVARFECLSYLARYKKNQLTAMDSELLESLADTAEEKTDELDAVLDALKQCVRGLTQEQQYLVQQRYHARTPLEHIAAQSQTSIGSIKQKLFRLRKQLKDCMLRRARR